MSMLLNRRRYERFTLPVGYSPVRVRPLGEPVQCDEGHAYDISEGGLRFELNEPIEPGTPVSIEIELPGQASQSVPGRSVYVIANVVWVSEDADEPGPVRMAAAFTRFPRAGDRERLLMALSSGRYARAA